MKNVFNYLFKYLHKFGDLILSIILFLIYIIIFFPYKIFSKKTISSWWRKAEKFNIKNKNLPF